MNTPAPPPRSRWRHARRAAWATAALVVLAAALLGWLFSSIGGRDFLLARIVTSLPADASLTWESAEGPASGPLTLRGVHFRWKGHELQARELMLDPALQPLIWRKLRLDALALRGASLSIAASEEPFKLPQWPDSLPAIDTPLPIQADHVEIDDLRIAQEGKPVIAISRLRGGVNVEPGRIHVEQLVVDSDRGRIRLHGDYRPADDYRTAIKGSWHVAAASGRPAARLGFAARGSLAAMHAQLRGVAPGPLGASVSLRGRQVPDWQLHAGVEGLDPALFTGAPVGAGWYGTLDVQGTGGEAKLDGRAQRGDFAVKLLPSKIVLQRQRLELKPLALEIFGGHATLAGLADFAVPEKATLSAQVQAKGLHWGEGDAQVMADGDFHLDGTTKAWSAAGAATLARGGQQAKVDFDARGDDKHMKVSKLLASMDHGSLDGSGELAWSPALAYGFDAKLSGFDPGYFAPDWPGAVDGRARIEGSRDDAGVDTHIVLQELGGVLRTRPLSGRAELRMHAPDAADAATDYEGDIALQLGNSHVEAKGKVAQVLSVDASFAPLQLADLFPQASGTLRGRLSLRGARTAPDLDVDLAGAQLAWGEWRAGTLVARGRLPWRGGKAAGALHVEGSELALGMDLAQLRVDARGSFEQLAVDAQAEGAGGHIELRGNVGHRGEAWQGTLAALQLAPKQGAAWRLDQAADFRWANGSGRIGPACLRAGEGAQAGRLCVHGEWPGQGIALTGEGLSLSLLQAYLPTRPGGASWNLHGDISLDARLQPQRGGGWSGNANIASASGGIAPMRRRASGRPPPPDLSRYRDLRLHAEFDTAGLKATLGSDFEGGGRIDAQLASGWAADSALSGNVAISTSHVGWLELFSPDIVAPTGHVEGHLLLGGTRQHPRLGGDAALMDFQAELPALGITLREGSLRLQAQPNGDGRLEGQVRSGDGVLRVDGTLGWSQASNPLEVHVSGKNVLASDTPRLHALIDPELTVKYAEGDEAISVSGTVTVPEARIALEILDQGALNSSDVVVLDPAEDASSNMRPVDLSLDLVAGEKVRMIGFGLDGLTTGRLHIRARPGREVIASGALDVDGTYVAYGAKLQITRGRVLWSNTPISDPALDIRAERVVGEVTAGIDVHGRASAPVPSVWSIPASSPSEAISYLALGRSLSTATSAESLRVGAARSALSVGGSLLAAQLGAKLGLDEAGVSQSRALGTEVIGAGKYLSPKLFVGYGVSLVGSGQVLTLKYLLRKGFDIEIESSTIENRASVNWRTER